MSQASTIASHIEITPGTCGGKPRIAGHRIRVQDIVLWTEEGRSADEIVAEFPQLSLADVYAALTSRRRSMQGCYERVTRCRLPLQPLNSACL
jgi:uncharacterized protein (DUF433 family)